MTTQLTLETLDGQALDLAPNFSISLDLLNTIFDSEVLKGSFSLPVNIPASPRNRVLFKFPENPASLSAIYSVGIRIRYGALTIFGVLRLKDTSDKTYSATVIAGVGTAAEMLKNTKLTDLNLTEIIPPPAEELRPFLKLGAYFLGGVPPEGTVIRASIWRYNSTTSIRQILYGVPFRNSIPDTLLDLAVAINTRRPIEVWSPTKNYTPFALVYASNGDLYEAQTHNLGKPLLPELFYLNNEYLLGQYVRDNDGYTYRCLANTQGVPLSNGIYWIQEDYPEWLLLTQAVNVRNLFLAGTTPHWYKYDDPADDYSIEAVANINEITLYDKQYGTPHEIDYYLTFNDDPLAFQWIEVQVSPPPLGFVKPYSVGAYMNSKATQAYPAVTHTFFPILNPDGSDVFFWETTPYVNYFAFGGTFFNEGMRAYFCQPQLYLFFILERLFAFMGYTADFSAFDDARYSEYKQLVVYNNNSMEGFLNAVIENRQRGTPISSIDLSRHVPDMTLGEFLNAIRVFLGLQVDFSLASRKAIITPLRELVTQVSAVTEEDWTALCEPQAANSENEAQGFTLRFEPDESDKFVEEKVKSLDGMLVAAPVQVVADLPAFPQNPTEVRLVQSENVYYKAVLDEETDTYSWEYFSEPLQDFVQGDGQQSVSTVAMPLTMFRGMDENYVREWLVPAVKQPLSLTGLGKSRQPFGLRLVFYRGLHKDSLNNVYPLASSDVYNWQGQKIADKSLRWDGQEGLYRNLYVDWLAFLGATRLVKRKIRLEALHLNRLSFGKAIRIEGVRYLVYRVRVTLPITKPAEVELYRL